MNLTQELTTLKENIRANHSDEIKAVMDQATQDLIQANLVEHSLSVGDRIPEITLPNALGQSIRMQTLLKQGPVVLSFYRGGWCPYCNLELRALQTALDKIQETGATLVAISPETPDHSLSTKEKNELAFDVLSDVGNRVAKQFGLVFQVPEILRPIYASFGIDLPDHNGDDQFEIPIPATYVIDSDGIISFAYANADYTQRLDPSELVAALSQTTTTV